MPLRPYQTALIHQLYEHWQSGYRRLMLQLATGGGKTVLFAAIAQSFVTHGYRVLVLAHREELITQGAAKLTAITGHAVGIIKAGYPFEPDHPVQVASVQTIVNRLDQVSGVDLVVIDEAHHSTAATYQRILNHFPQTLQLGVSATPCRADGSGFADVFDEMVVGPSVASLIEQGYLSQFRLLADDQPMQTTGVRSRGGDYSAGELAAANDAIALSGSLVGSYRKHAMGKRAIVFAINCAHSRAIAAAYNNAGIPAAHLDGTTPADERRSVLAAFSAGELWVLSNCELFTEGFDLPALEAVQLARPTKSLSLYLQMVGRVLRTAPGKEQALILDHTKNYLIHGLPTRPRLWSLDGVESESREVRRNQTGEVVEAEPVLIEETPAELQEIIVDPLAEWRLCWETLKETQQQRGHKKGWIMHRLKEIGAPLEIWELAAAYLGYKRGWAWHRWQEAQAAQAIA